MKILILFFGLFVVGEMLTALSTYGQQTQSVEIYVRGHKYDSLESYKASKQRFDFADHQWNSWHIHTLYLSGVENGLTRALYDFYKPLGVSLLPLASSTIFKSQMQRVIQQAITLSADPKLLIVDGNRLRIMTIKEESLH